MFNRDGMARESSDGKIGTRVFIELTRSFDGEQGIHIVYRIIDFRKPVLEAFEQKKIPLNRSEAAFIVNELSNWLNKERWSSD